MLCYINGLFLFILLCRCVISAALYIIMLHHIMIYTVYFIYIMLYLFLFIYFLFYFIMIIICNIKKFKFNYF